MHFLKTSSLLSLAATALAQGDLGALLASQPDLSTLLSLVQLAGLNSTLSTASNITILAPTNSAFQALDPNGIIAQAAAAKNVAAVTAVLSNHVIQGLYPANATSNVPAFVQTLLKPNTTDPSSSLTRIRNGSYVGLVKNGNGVNVIAPNLVVANVTTADVRLGNIVIHKIDTVLPLPLSFLELTAQAGYTDINAAIVAAQVPLPLGANPAASNLTDFTIFVPNNAAFNSIASVLTSVNTSVIQAVLGYHVITNNIVFSPSLGNVSVPSVQGGNLTLSVLPDGSAFVNNAKIIFPNVIFNGGVFHVIDNVLNPLVPFNRTQLTPNAPAASRVAYAGATSASSLPFSSVSFGSATTRSVSTPAILTTAPAVNTASRTASATTAVNTGAAAPVRIVSGPLATAGAVLMAGAAFALNM